MLKHTNALLQNIHGFTSHAKSYSSSDSVAHFGFVLMFTSKLVIL